jgi:hypothetical protein
MLEKTLKGHFPEGTFWENILENSEYSDTLKIWGGYTLLNVFLNLHKN